MTIPRLIPAFLAVLCLAAAPQGASARELTTVVSQTTVTSDPTATSQKASTPKGLTVKGNKNFFLQKRQHGEIPLVELQRNQILFRN